MTHQLGGKQYVLTGVDGVLYAWSLPSDYTRTEARNRHATTAAGQPNIQPLCRHLLRLVDLRRRLYQSLLRRRHDLLRLPGLLPSFSAALGFTRAEVTQGFLLGFLVVGIPFGFLTGALIDRIGARWVILFGVGFIGIPLILMGSMTRLWHYELLCILEVMGYTLTGPSPIRSSSRNGSAPAVAEPWATLISASV